jgi:hypothetical protein
MQDLQSSCLLDIATQVKGEVKVEDVSNGSEEDEYIFTITVEGTGSEQVYAWSVICVLFMIKMLYLHFRDTR